MNLSEKWINIQAVNIWSGISLKKLLFVESVLLAMDYNVELDGCYSAPQNLVGLAIFGVLWAQGPEEGIQIWWGYWKGHDHLGK